MAVEREIDRNYEKSVFRSLQFDDSDSILIFPDMQGICFYDLKAGKELYKTGVFEQNERFLSCMLYQGVAKKNPSNNAMEKTKKEVDPLLLCTSFKKQRFYIFSRREPEDQSNINRDIFNEKPTREDQQN